MASVEKFPFQRCPGEVPYREQLYGKGESKFQKKIVNLPLGAGTARLVLLIHILRQVLRFAGQAFIFNLSSSYFNESGRCS
jgi:hypothetical protein